LIFGGLNQMVGYRRGTRPPLALMVGITNSEMRMQKPPVKRRLALAFNAGSK
jgi:hypothetical protein